MFLSSKNPFSVGNSTIEDVGEGADNNSAPPRLPSFQTTPATELQPRFATNPFSLSRNPLRSHICTSSQYSVNTLNSLASVSSSVSCASSSQHSLNTSNKLSSSLASPQSSFSLVHSLFPNPFTLNRDLDLQPAPIVTKKTVVDFLIPSSSALTPPNTQNLSKSFTPCTSTTISPTPDTTTRKPRKARPDRALISSPFRPRVMAVDRLFSWRTPYGLSHDESLLAELPPALVESAKISIMGALATSSRSTYAAGLLRFNQFCDKWQISEDARMPASYALLCAFIGNYKGTTSGKTIKSWLSGLRAWHLTNHAPWYGDDKWVQMARISANKEGSRYKRPLRAPVSIEHLLALRRAITISTPFHAAVWAVALVTFFGCRRLGETTVSSVSSFDPSLHVLRSAECVYPLLLFSLLNIIFAVFLLSLYVTVHAQRRSTFLGRKLLAKRVPQLFSPPATTNFVLAQPCEITSTLIAMSQGPPPCLPILPLMGAGST